MQEGGFSMETVKVKIDKARVKTVLQCLCHVIVFHRAFFSTEPMDIEDDDLEIAYTTVKNKKLRDLIDEKAKLAIESNSLKKGSNLFCLKFYTSIESGLWVFQTKKKKPWEIWTIKIEIVNEKPTEDQLQKSMIRAIKTIMKSAANNNEHLPGVNEEHDDNGCYSFDIEQVTEKKATLLSNISQYIR
mmetsp:Transcript_6824/g.9960  ORF Transcript_6824/g.9960 Transcript_6824/m.9960 type:complete len:187 (-) Transcript_6824:138-698(-)